ncbi:Os01g0834950 [Oryza sativa Japonica Group]|uniref:Os01g0834950 protein n=1 Tax=Oryza sativa subsp. japonica TaxID=39947 RepID=C7IY11_ORYSJ|nr:Os01g0834950 [Oryza sativa Japonica Group]|eukprot:NP_001172638.1 Os01g0834950 [Oryza sativa Japonica Group]
MHNSYAHHRSTPELPSVCRRCCSSVELWLPVLASGAPRRSSPEAVIPVLSGHHEAAQGLGDLQLELPPLQRRPLLLVAAAAVAGIAVLHCLHYS